MGSSEVKEEEKEEEIEAMEEIEGLRVGSSSREWCSPGVGVVGDVLVILKKRKN